jgi:acetyl esterase/lipase
MNVGDDLGSVGDLTQPLPDVVVRYAAHDDGLVDVHLPPGSTTEAPLAVLLHGGFWKNAYDRRHTRAAASALAQEGFVVATPEYRRVGGGGGWPTTGDDVDDAIAAIPGLLDGLGVSTTGLTVAGHSAGGHLALWLANGRHALDRVVALAPVADLRAAARDRLGGAATQALLGGEPEEAPEAYAAADPLTRLANHPACEVVVLHGDLDEDVPLTQSTALAWARPFVDLRVLQGAGHFDVIDPTSHAWPAVVAAMRGLRA